MSKRILALSMLLAATCVAQVSFTSKPSNLQFVARSANDSGVVSITGVVSQAGVDSVTVAVYRNGAAYGHFGQALVYLDGKASFLLAPRIHAELASYRLEVRVGDSVALTADSVVCGDAFLADGQSNAELSGIHYISPWLRTFGLDSLWHNPADNKANANFWGMDRHVIEEQQVPVCVINGAAGGSRIYQHAARSTTSATIYGRIYRRIVLSGLRNGIKAAVWHQGEHDGDSLSAAAYAGYFKMMVLNWRFDFPGKWPVYAFQVRPVSCVSTALSGDALREAQRTLPRVIDVSIMSTTNVAGSDGCHYGAAGYAQMGDRMYRLVARDLYGSADTVRTQPPDIRKAFFADSTRTEIGLQFNQPVTVSIDSLGHALREAFFLEGDSANRIDSTRIDTTDNLVRLFLRSPSPAGAVSYTPSIYYPGTSEVFQGPWLKNSREVGALTFHQFPIAAFEDAEAPTAPLILSAIVVPPYNMVRLTWSPSSDNAGITGYRIYRNGSLAATTVDTTCMVKYLEWNSRNLLAVRAMDQAGNLSNVFDTIGVSIGSDTAQTVYLSDREAVAAISGVGFVELDRSNLGTPIKINNVTYAKGLGVHSVSYIVYALGKQFQRFKSDYGFDDAKSCPFSISFAVYGDNLLKFESGSFLRGVPTRTLDIDIAGMDTLTLVVDTGTGFSGGGAETFFDYADWADARVSRGADTTEIHPGLDASTLPLLTVSPNPFNPFARITVRLPCRPGFSEERAVLAVFDISGKRIWSVEIPSFRNGTRTVEWAGKDTNGRPLGSGVYFMRLVMDGRKSGAVKLTLMR